MSRRLRLPVLAACLVALVLGCGDSATSPSVGRVDLVYRYYVGSQPLVPPGNQYFLLRGSGSSLFNVEVLRYYVSNFGLDGPSGGGYGSREPVLLDAIRQSSAYENVISFVNVPTGTYNRLRFTFGMNEDDNVAGKWDLRSGADINMQWPEPLGGGYHYMQMEGRFRDADGDTLGYATHLGRVGDSPHFYEVDLEVDQFTLEQGKTIRIPVFMNILEFYNNPHDYDFPEPSFIMNNDSLQTVLEENAKATVWSVGLPTPPDYEN